MNKYAVFRLACLIGLWLLLCYIVVANQPFTLRVAFIVLASGIVVFVPIYKKYKKNKGNA